MKAGGGRIKGSSFERKVASLVVKTFAHRGITPEDCYRTPLSGGHRFAAKHDPGDLLVSRRLCKYFPFAAECKFYRSLDWHLLFAGDVHDKSHWCKWWKQACTAASANGKLTPLLVFKQNRSDIFAMYSAEGNGWVPPCKYRPILLTRVNGIRVRVVLFSDLLKSLA